MSGKLDQSLDQIMQDTKPAGGRGNRQRRPRPARNAKAKAKAAIAAPTGGVQKTKAASKAPAVAAPSLTKATPGESKIIVSNLPEDVTETQIKVR
jgi:THO complex subunit 4